MAAIACVFFLPAAGAEPERPIKPQESGILWGHDYLFACSVMLRKSLVIPDFCSHFVPQPLLVGIRDKDNSEQAFLPQPEIYRVGMPPPGSGRPNSSSVCRFDRGDLRTRSITSHFRSVPMRPYRCRSPGEFKKSSRFMTICLPERRISVVRITYRRFISLMKWNET